MICKLCQNERKLIKAHIIPETFFTSINTTEIPNKIISNQSDYRPKRSPIGVYDQELVCKECEDSFHIYDDYAISLFRDKFNSHNKIVSKRGHEGYNLDVDYQKLRLFFVSLLWRASASNHEFYSRVKLKEEEELRQLFLNLDTSNPQTFGVVGFKFECDPELVSMIGPYESVSIGVPVITFVFYGFKFLISIKDGKFSDVINSAVLQPGVKWPIIFTPYKNSKYWDAVKAIADMQRHKVF